MDVPTEQTDENGALRFDEDGNPFQRQLHIGHQLIAVEAPDGTVGFVRRNVVMCENCVAQEEQRKSVTRLIVPGIRGIQQ
jgi:hypothetical protein